MEYGIRWTEFDRNDRMRTKERFFKTEAALQRFIDKLTQKDNFYQIIASCQS